jgi:hypothetical protein
MYDPDGFDRTDPHLFERYFTRGEYERGMVSCTVAIHYGGRAYKVIEKVRKACGL